jgi:hypothetical protein
VSRDDEPFERHAREQRERWLALTPEERLFWLERAKRFARLALEVERRPRPGEPEPGAREPKR